jgi:histidyl-tRNA synthetase
LDFYSRLASNLGSAVRFDLNLNKQFGLRSHNFLSVLRAYVSHRVFEQEQVTKWYYIAPSFGIEKNTIAPVYEYGAVVFGEPTGISDAQLIAVLKILLEDLGFDNLIFEINHRGCELCAVNYEEVLERELQQQKSDFCSRCQALIDADRRALGPGDEGLYGVFSCDNERCQELVGQLPQIIDYLDAPCTKQLTTLLESLDELEIPYQLNPRLFGGSWLSHTVFRLKVGVGDGPGCGELPFATGGRYTRFVSKFLNQQLPVLLFSVPLSQIADLVAQHACEKKPRRTADVFLINLGELAAKKSLRLFIELWKHNIRVAEHFGQNGIKNQFKLAEKKGCPLALVIGQKEALEGSVILRDVRSGIQEVFPYERIIEEIQKRLQD